MFSPFFKCYLIMNVIRLYLLWFWDELEVSGILFLVLFEEASVTVFLYCIYTKNLTAHSSENLKLIYQQQDCKHDHIVFTQIDILSHILFTWKTLSHPQNLAKHSNHV